MLIDKSKYPDRKYLRWIDQPGYIGWQFWYENPPLPETKFFNIKWHGGVDGAYEKAKSYRDNYIEAAKALGVWGISQESSRLPVNIKISKSNTSGIVGVSRKCYDRKDRKHPEEQWLANYKTPEGKQLQEKYTISVLGEKQALYNAIRYRRDYIQRVLDSTNIATHRNILATHIEELTGLMEYVNAINDSDLAHFVKTITDEKIAFTEKQKYLSIRIGQQIFRKKVLEYWKNTCAVTGAKILLTAAHIKPWKDSNNMERISEYNGIALSPVYDKAFDVGLISFADNGEILLSNEIQAHLKVLRINGNERINGFNFAHYKFLQYHRDNIFIK